MAQTWALMRRILSEGKGRVSGRKIRSAEARQGKQEENG